MLTNRVPIDEYHRRWRAAQRVARENRVEGLVVWSRGGGPVDNAEDVIYLANYWSSTPLVPDLPGIWSGLSNAALIIPLDREPILVTDSPEYRRDVVPVQDVRHSGLVPDAVAEILRELNLSESRVGLVAGNAMLISPYRRLLNCCPYTAFVQMDNAVEQIRVIKTAQEFQFLREAAEVGVAAMEAMMGAALVPGITEAGAVALAYKTAVERGAAMVDAPTASGPHSESYAHGQAPAWTARTLAVGDLFHSDIYGAAVEGYRFDFSRTVVCGGHPSAVQRELLEGAIAAVEAGIAATYPGARAHDIWSAVQIQLDSRGIGAGYGVAGHGLGLGWEPPWLIPDNMELIRPGMALAIETMAGVPGVGRVKFEQNLLVHEDRVEVTTAGCPATFWI